MCAMCTVIINNKDAMAELVSQYEDMMGEREENSDFHEDTTDQQSQNDQEDGSERDSTYHEERFRVDRRKLEQMLQVVDENCCTEPAEEFFCKIMEETNTHITWPSKLKIGAKSKKDPHIKVGGKKEDVAEAKEKIMTVLDTKSTRVTLKMDVSHTEHSHVIGKGGNNIKRVMQETDCHIHFPDSNRNNQVEKSNQVSIAGQPFGVERARVQIRDLLPLVLMFELPVTPVMQTIPDTSSPTIQHIQNTYCVSVSFKQRPKLYKTTVIVRGSVASAKAVKEATALLMEHLAGSLAASLPVSLQLEIAPQHHLFIIGRGGVNIKQIMQRTGANILFPDSSAAQVQRKGAVYITGCIESVYLARQHLIGCLPLVLMFDMKDESDIEQSELSALMDQLDVFISIKPKPKQPSKSVIVKSIERNAPNLHRARRCLLGLTVVPPPGLHHSHLDNDASTGVSSLGMLGHNVLNANPLLMMNGSTASSSSAVTAASTPPLLSPSPGPNPYLVNPLVVLAPSAATYSLQSTVGLLSPPPLPALNGQTHCLKQPLTAPAKATVMSSSTVAETAKGSTDGNNVNIKTRESSQRWYCEKVSSPCSSPPNLMSAKSHLSSALSDSGSLCLSSLAGIDHMQSKKTASSLMDVVLPRRTSSSPPRDLFGFANCGSASPLASSSTSPTTSPNSPLVKRQTVYLNDRITAAAFQNAEQRSSESGCDSDSSEHKLGSNDILINSTASALFGGNSFFSEFDSEQKKLADYEKKKVLADKAMQKKPEGESRTPTDIWSGLGFSKSMPDSAIRDRLRQAGSRYKGPSMTTTYENGEIENEPWPLNGLESTPMDGLTTSSTHSHLTISAAPGDFPSPRRKLPGADYGMRGPAVMCPPNDWQHSKADTDRLAELFNKLGLCKYTDLFQQQEIDMATFLTLTDQDLRELGIATFGARKKMLLAIADLSKGQTLMSAAPGDNNPFRNSGASRNTIGRRHDIASQSGRW